MKKELHIIGLMSGSSLDGLDMAYCKFNYDVHDGLIGINEWSIKQAQTTIIPHELKSQLSIAHNLDIKKMQILDVLLGQFIGIELESFIQKHKLNPIDLIASHGHTVIHKPNQGISLQIGNGESIAAITGLPVINHFRNKDIEHGGQGAPVAPIADRFLFKGYDFYLNLGGIANISYHKNENWFAYDISGANQMLNALANKLQLSFDDKGNKARSGQKIEALYHQLNKHAYLDKSPPKSLDNQFVFQEFTQVLLDHEGKISDKLCTACHHIASQISIAIEKAELDKPEMSMFCTGGGVFNEYLIELIKDYCNKRLKVKIDIPSAEIINYKEAALMALMGLLHHEKIPNVMSSVTGANKDTINGELHLPKALNITA